jgi:hypothetical protein
MRRLTLHSAPFMILVLLTAACVPEGREAVFRPPENFGTLVGRIFDADGEVPMPARVVVRGSNGTVYMAEDGLAYVRRESPEFDRHFTTIGNTFTVFLPPGPATITIERGKEYETLQETIDVATGTTVRKDFVLTRWIHMAERDWYAGDFHVHRPLKDVAGLILADDLNVALVQSVWNNRRDPELEQYLERADADGVIVADEQHLYSVLSQEIERYGGALMMNAIGTQEISFSGWYDNRNPTDLSLIDQVRAQNGYIDLEKPLWRESHINVALGGADFIGLAHNHFWYSGGSLEDAWGWSRHELDTVYPGGLVGLVRYTCDLYYAFLNCGFRVMPSAGSATGVMPSPVGYNRVYAQVEGEFTFRNWLRALKAGRSFATNGPMLIMTADGQPMGSTVSVSRADAEVTVVCEINSRDPIDRLEIIRDGAVVHTVRPEISDNHARVEVRVPVAQSGWIAARCFEPSTDTERFAHTAPIFLDVPGRPFIPVRKAVEYFLGRTRALIAETESGVPPTYRGTRVYERHLKEIDFKSDEHRVATLKVYRDAVEIFEGLLAE